MSLNAIGTGYIRLISLVVFACWTASVGAAVVKTNAVADAEIGERPALDRGSNSDQLNFRIAPANDRNEIVALKFDLTTIDLPNATSATINLINYRDGSTRTYVVYGVTDGALGGDNNAPTTPAQGFDDNTWDETLVKMSTMPGVIYDGDSSVTSQGIDPTKTTNLGGGALNGGLKGTVTPLNPAGLLGFLQTHPDDLVTLLITKDTATPNSGQERFASKETIALMDGAPTGAAGDFAPYLEFLFPDVGVLPGDFNDDDVVNAADYVVWRENFNTTNTLPNDTVGGTIDEDQYNLWKTNFGNSPPGSAAIVSGAPVPEPACWVLAALAVIGFLGVRKMRD